MKIISPNFYLSSPGKSGIEMLQFIEAQARISHRSEDKQTPDSWKRFITAVVIEHGDWSVTEHVSITATIRTDRGVTHELVRHRLFSFTQESTRFVRYNSEIEFIRPAVMLDLVAPGANFLWEDSLAAAEATYHDLIAKGVRPQEARSVLPNATATTIAMTGNLRNWRHFFLMRTTKETHPDMKRITVPMLDNFKKLIPLLYDDITPEQRQIENLRKPR